MSSRKSKILIAIIILLIITGVVVFLNIADSLRFSKDPGVYDEDIELEITGGIFGSVHYTLDGTEPTLDSPKYDGAITLTDATSQPNRASMRTDSSVGFDGELCDELSPEFGDPGYKAPDYNIDKGYYVKATYFDIFGVEKEEIEGTYFVNLDEKEIYDDMAIVSLTTADENLWDYDDGIYCTGVDWDKYKEQLLAGDVTESAWGYWGANYRRSGEEYEKEATLTVYDEDHNQILNQDCGIRIHGNFSMSENQKSFSLFSRTEYSGSDTFSADLTNSGYLQHKYVLTAGGQDQVTKMTDYLISEIAEGLSYCTIDYRPCMLFLNGEFWGFYFISEPYNAEYIAGHYGVDKDNVIIYKNGFVVEGDDDDAESYDEMTDFITNNDMSDPDNYAKACQYMDIYSFVDYYATMHYLHRDGDWPYGNEACWRVRDVSEESGASDGKWRWMMFDCNSNDGVCNVDEVDEVDWMIQEALWLSLYNNDDFKTLYTMRLQYIAYTQFDPTYVANCIDEFNNKYMAALEASSMRFYGVTNEDALVENAFYKKFYFARRHDIIPSVVGYVFGMGYIYEDED